MGCDRAGVSTPKQIPDINATFTPDAASVVHARQVIEAFAQCDGGLLVYKGKLIEKPVLRSFARMLAVYDVAHAK